MAESSTRFFLREASTRVGPGSWPMHTTRTDAPRSACARARTRTCVSIPPGAGG